MDTGAVMATTVVAVVILMAGLWLLSLVTRDVSIVDIFWGLGFILVAHVARTTAGAHDPRAWLVTVLVTIWGLRLALYLLWRNWGQGEDYRYAAMRAHYGERFRWVSLCTVFGLQGVLMWFISLPVQIAVTAGAPATLTGLDAIGLACWTVGFGFEAIGDWQLARFKADPATRGTVMDRGLWAYTRHPNYFGDALAWWGLYLIAAATPSGAWTVLSPVVMTVLLMRVSGVALLERKLKKTRPEYAAYCRRVNAFVPWFPRRA